MIFTKREPVSVGEMITDGRSQKLQLKAKSCCQLITGKCCIARPDPKFCLRSGASVVMLEEIARGEVIYER
jgi:hypothetical protein